MTAQQVREAGRIPGIAGCFLTGFRYDSAFMASPANQQALRDVVTTLAAQPGGGMHPDLKREFTDSDTVKEPAFVSLPPPSA
jgi:hypothetical protein